MVTQGILSVFISAMKGIFSLLPDVSFDVANSAYQTFMDFVQGVFYFFPMDTVVTILGIYLSLQLIRLILSLVQSLKASIPFL